MARVFAENVYSFRAYRSVLQGIVDVAPGDLGHVSDIEAALLQASQGFAARNYQDAINAYLKAQSLVYALLDNTWNIGLGWLRPMPRSPTLFEPLLSASLEWLNIVPVNGPSAPVRPRVEVDQGAIAAVAPLRAAGLFTPTVSSAAALQAAADLHLSETLQSLGNPTAAQFYQTRASQADSQAVQILRPSGGGAVAPAPSAPLVSPVAIHFTAPVTAHAFTAVSQGEVLRLVGRTPIVIPPAATANRTLGVLVSGNTVKTIGWAAGGAPALTDVRDAAYLSRSAAAVLDDAITLPALASDFVLAIPHHYFYVIPLGLAECHHALGDWAQAEQLYFSAAAYAYLNAAVEVPYLWIRLATLYLDWGDRLYMAGDVTNALPVYEKVLGADGATPAAGPLYTTTSLAPAATVARTVITNLKGLIANPPSAAALNLNPKMCAVVLQVHQRLVQIAAGLDYWGHWAPRVPIWTFAYLQQVAINFAQLAIAAEQQVISFWDRADQGRLTELQLNQQVASAQTEVSAAQAQTDAALAQQAVYQAGFNLAQQRAADARANAGEYQATSSSAIVHQALQSQLSGGDDGNSDQLNAYAATMMSGSYNLSDSRATLAAAEQLTAARLSQQYEVDSLNRTADELQTAQSQAGAELTASAAQVAAAQAAQAVAGLKADEAAAMAAAFSSQTFTPDVWQAMGYEMTRLYGRYFDMALKVAKLMQQAYNFETDQHLNVIKSSYASDQVRGLLGADALMADIQGFTYNLITTSRSKAQPIKQTISLAQSYGFAFETQFRKTGSMTFETRVDDFDNNYPGTYAGRIQSVRVDVVGLVPVTGLSGTLTNAGISWYRLPSAAWPAGDPVGLKARVQTAETLVLSDFSAQSDSLLVAPDDRIGGIFAGAAPVSTWRLDIPRAVNDIDFGALLDVTITFTYSARYDPDLAVRVKAQMAGRPGANSRLRGIPLRWVYPDLFFAFAHTGALALQLGLSDFPLDQANPQVTSVGLQVSTVAPQAASGLTFSLATPGRAAPAKAATDANGTISSLAVGSAWAPLATGTALGQYALSLDAADNPTLVSGGTLDLSRIGNIALVLGYSFTARG